MLEQSPTQKFILLVEDNRDDVLLIRRAFERAAFGVRLLSVPTGMEAIAYLNGEHPYHERTRFPLPDLVLLDIKMPGTDGFEVLSWIRDQRQFSDLPVVMLTSSDEIRDVNRAYQLGANSFLVKPLDFENARELSLSLDRLLQGRRS
jgi:CheY-like chemotaxis protein